MPASRLTRDAIAIWLAGVEAVQADRVVESQTEWDGRWLTISDRVFDLKESNRLVLVGAGKATAGMLSGLFSALEQSNKKLPNICGWINVPEGVAIPQGPMSGMVTVSQARPQGCNEPTEAVVEGTKKILEWVRQAGPKDCVISLISGGGSALLCSPVAGVSLVEKGALTRALSGAGANIKQLNSVRRCLSNVKGGGLARACSARHLITCILSDVLGDPLHLIASGPTVLNPPPDPEQAIEILRRLLPDQFPSILAILNKQLDTSRSKLANAKSQTRDWEPIVLANNATAVDAAGQKAVELGYRYWMKSEKQSEGAASLLGEQFATQLNATLEQSHIDCIISGGEPTVMLPSVAERGRGGRNQQLVLSLLNHFHQQHSWPNESELAFVSGGTDGEDGPTDAAGAFVDREVVERMRQLRLDPVDYLKRCDAYTFFQQTFGLLQTGPTGTNVCDLRVGLVRR